jgi:hypothetical protein
MHVIACIGDPDVVKKILKHPGSWDIQLKPMPVANGPPIDIFPVYDDSPGPTANDYIVAPDYPAEACS